MVQIELLSVPPRQIASWLDWPVHFRINVTEITVYELNTSHISMSLVHAEIRNFTKTRDLEYEFEVWHPGAGFIEVWVERGRLWDENKNENLEVRGRGVEVVELLYRPEPGFWGRAEWYMPSVVGGATFLVGIVLSLVLCVRACKRRKARKKVQQEKWWREYHHREEEQMANFQNQRKRRQGQKKKMKGKKGKVQVAPVPTLAMVAERQAYPALESKKGEFEVAE